MGEHFDIEPKSYFDAFSSLQSVDNVSFKPAGDSTIQLFEGQTGSEEQQWRPHVRDWLVFICVVILAMMDAFDSTVMITVLPVGQPSQTLNNKKNQTNSE